MSIQPIFNLHILYIKHTEICRNHTYEVTISTAERLEARILSELHTLVKNATELQGGTITDFIITTTKEAEKRAVEETEILRIAI
ncbi:DUF1778 domain-containing protein [Pectobacterium sp. CHL-2024]|uniref:type II toxin -antitoxin system TacA 1-like antitoxin n=1 Tax=Pectobacterium sp. CHL-2024 TaxID=3377079 RepID=UPI00380305F7